MQDDNEYSGRDLSFQTENVAELIELYFRKGWTDGLPVIPPSTNSVEAMLKAAGLKGNDPIAEVRDRNVFITPDKVAINAVMAGCRPEYMPVVITAVKCLCHPDFGYHGIAASTGGASVVIIVNGPIARKIGINFGENLFGPGIRSNLTIGRALRLLMINTIHTSPGILDRSTFGSPGKISFCFAENEELCKWDPLHVERGFQLNESTTTLFAAEDIIQIYNQLARTPEPLLIGVADAMANMGSMNIIGQQQVVVVFGGEHAAVLTKNGWPKARIRNFIFEHAKRNVADLKTAGRIAGKPNPGDKDIYRHAVRQPEDIILMCAGGSVGSFSACLLGWGSFKATRSVTLPIHMP
ncbi:MAG: hypothetical protein H8D67_13390 [Deltaproteobacteria bacterium]|nr:hypothetical protein [Deltaproteobacteria bacterium]